jgi:proteasome lid subunit RPN8/RPN11
MTCARQSRPPVRLAQHTFLRLMRELDDRSQQRREAGAFLLGPASGQAITRVAYYDDLDPTCLTGSITFHASGYTKLNQLCRDDQVRVIADIHLHPGLSVRQSDTDAAHPMVARVGHLALIAPQFGRGVTRADQLGAHLKVAEGWHTFLKSEVADVFVVHPTWRGRLMQLTSFLRRITPWSSM